MTIRVHAAVALALVALTGALYAPTLDDPWHFDDRSEITRNVREFSPDLPSWHYRGVVVRWLWALDYRLHGENPRGFHVTNAAIHAGNSILLYWIAWMLGAGVPARRRAFAAAAAALVFCAHPLATQAVSYVTQRSTSLAALFFLLALGAWIRFRAGPPGQRAAFAAVALAAFAAGLYTKHVVLMLPPVLLAYELLFRPRPRRAGVLLLVAFFALSLFRAVEYLPWMKTGAPGPRPAATEVTSHGYTTAEYALTQPRAVVTYLRFFLWPKGQSLDHDIRASRSATEPAVAGSLAVLVAVAALGWRTRHRWPVATLGIALFFLALVPTSSVIRSADLLFEHRAYLPMAGLCLAVGGAVSAAAARRWTMTTAALVAAVAALGVATVRRNAVWDSEIALWSDVVSKAPGRSRGYVNLGMALQEAGRLDEAAAQYRRALQVDPDQVAARNDLGNLMRRRGRRDEAEALYREAIARAPRYVEPWINLGNTAMDGGRFAEAERDYRHALELSPQDATARYNLAKSLESQDRLDEAIRAYDALLAAHPDEPRYLNDRGAACILRGDMAAAEADLRAAAARAPQWSAPWLNLTLVLEAQGRAAEAEQARARARSGQAGR